MIRRGTTPTHTWTLPFGEQYIKDIRASYSQNEQEVIVKTIDDVVIDGNVLSVDLTQEETFSLEEGTVNMQLRVLTKNDKVVATDIVEKEVYKALNDEVLK